MKGFVLRRLEPHADVILRSYASGASFEELAEQFRCSWTTIRRFLLAQDVALRARVRNRKLDPYKGEVISAYRAGTDIPAIAARFQVRPQTVRNYLVEVGEAALRNAA